MKTAVLIITIFAIGSCGGVKKQPTICGMAVREIADSPILSFVSPIRPGEKLKHGETYVDEFEFDRYSDESDFNVFMVHKSDGEQVGLFDYIGSGLDHSFSTKNFCGESESTSRTGQKKEGRP